MPEFDIDQVNKVRLAMGMKPLPGGASGPVFKESKDQASSDEEPASTIDTRQAAAGDNWKRLQDEEAAKAKRQAQKDAIKKARDAAQRFAKLEGKGLADEDGEMDTTSWLKQHKKRQQKLEKARKLEQELAERERQAEYTAADLAGVKVGHELNQFDEEAGEQILTLKDAAVDAESDDDELENADLRDREKLEERLASKKKKLAYDPNSTDGGGKGGLLSQYDEEIDGKKHQRFTLDGRGSIREAAMDVDADSAKSKGITISLDILKDDVPISDYVEASEVKIKKTKKKKSKSTKRKALDDDDIFAGADSTAAAPGDTVTDMDLDEKDTNGTTSFAMKRALDDTNFADDEDLQAELAQQRRAALKKRKKMRPEDLARELREEESATPRVFDSIEAEDDEPGLVIDETSEFVANLQKPMAPERRRPRSAQPSAGLDVRSPDEAGDVEMEQSYNEVGEDKSASRELSPEKSTPADGNTATGLEDEANLNQGLGATLNMLSQRGLVKTAANGDINAQYRERQRFLAEKQKREGEAEQRARLQRERDRQSGKLDRMSAREREDYARRTNASRDQIESRQIAEAFNREYKPDVQLKYVDDHGRSMNQKEAFKHLSHQFHGKGSGKQKTEKRLKKIDEEKRKEGMSILDASQNSTNMNSAVGDRAKKNRQAGVRLQ